MRKRISINSIIVLAALLFSAKPGLSVAKEDSKSPLVVTLAYYSIDNKVPCLTVTAKSKVDGKFQPVNKAEVKLYLDKDAAGNGLGFIGKAVTNEKGRAVTYIPPTLGEVMKKTPNHTFLAVTDKTKQFDETSSELSIAKARITIDTADDKNVTATVAEFKDNQWVPVKGVDVKLAIRRLGGDLQIGDEQSYTTDSLGQVKGEFKKMKMPGDAIGNIAIVAKVEDNDQYGNLRIEKTIPWGAKFIAEENMLAHRALWASRFHSPVWLVFIAYTTIIAVWGTLIYLIVLLIKIKRLGSQDHL
jgi:hypothetical protein